MIEVRVWIHTNNIYTKELWMIEFNSSHARTYKNKKKNIVYYSWTPTKKMSFSIIIDIIWGEYTDINSPCSILKFEKKRTYSEETSD